MKATVKAIKENPIKSISGIVTILSFIFGSIFWIDTRYVHADDLHKLVVQQSLERAQERVVDYEDRLEDIELKEQLGKATEFDKASKPRLERKIKDLQKTVRDLTIDK